MFGYRILLIWTLRVFGAGTFVLSLPELVTLGMIVTGHTPPGAPETLPIARDAATSFAVPLLTLGVAEAISPNKNEAAGNAR